MANDLDSFCIIYVDSELSREELIRYLAQNLAGEVKPFPASGIRVGKDSKITVKRNDQPTTDTSDDPDFLFFPYYLEIENYSNDLQAQIELVSKLLHMFWDSKTRATAACDYEELLPEKGGRDTGAPWKQKLNP